MDAPFLSICIPTYNRVTCLEQCLDSIVDQFTDLDVRGLVEIAISDNNSTDGTAELVGKFQTKYPNILYKRNSENLGVDRNILQAVEMSHGKYVWLFGDDDALFPGSLKYLLKEIDTKKFKYCVVNFWAYDNKLEHPALSLPNQRVQTDQFFTQLSDYIQKAGPNADLVGFFCGLSAQVFDRSLWQALSDKQKFIGTNAVHLYILLSVMQNQSFAILAKPLLKARSANTRWDSFEGLDSAKLRARETFKVLMWILDFYKIPHSKLVIKYNYYSYVVKSFIINFIKKNMFKSQKSRDRIKKILNKL